MFFQRDFNGLSIVLRVRSIEKVSEIERDRLTATSLWTGDDGYRKDRQTLTAGRRTLQDSVIISDGGYKKERKKDKT